MRGLSHIVWHSEDVSDLAKAAFDVTVCSSNQPVFFRLILGPVWCAEVLRPHVFFVHMVVGMGDHCQVVVCVF